MCACLEALDTHISVMCVTYRMVISLTHLLHFVEPEDILKIVSFEDVNQIVGLEATLVCYADFIVTGIEVEYTIERDDDPDYLRNKM